MALVTIKMGRWRKAMLFADWAPGNLSNFEPKICV
jgi:hypothetical protein